MRFADIHNHILFGVDDGAKTEAEMRLFLDALYTDGARHICFTPHYHPGYFGENRDQVQKAFATARQYTTQHYPDLVLYLGNELRYEHSFSEWLSRERCQTLNDTQYLLVDFVSAESADVIMHAMTRILNSGFLPVLAHVERYRSFYRKKRALELLKTWGVVLQVDAQAPLGGFGYETKKRSFKLLDAGLIDVIASDAHTMFDCKTKLSSCYRALADRYGEHYASALFWNNPLCILKGKEIQSI